MSRETTRPRLSSSTFLAGDIRQRGAGPQRDRHTDLAASHERDHVLARLDRLVAAEERLRVLGPQP